MGTRSPTILTDLPVEILFFIAYHTRSYSAISALARATRLLHEILNPYLYRLNSRQAAGGYALRWAARYGNIATLRLAVQSRSSLVPSRPLLIAARFGHAEIVKDLLSVADGGLQARDHEGKTALSRAITAGHEEVVKMLLDAGALPDPQTRHRSYQSHARSALFAAIESGNVGIVRQLLARGRINVKGKYRNQNTTLSLSAKLGHSDLVKLFLDRGIPVNTRHSGHYTPLTYGIKSGSPDAVKMLLDAGADPNALHPSNHNTPIFFALRTKTARELVLQALVDDPRIKMNHVNGAGDSPLSFALQTWREGNRHRQWSSWIQERECSDEQVAILLTRNDLDPNVADAFAKAIHNNRLWIAERIFSHPQLTRESKFKGLREIVSYGYWNGRPTREAMFTRLFEYFLAECRDINEPAFDGMSLLMFACLHGNETVVDLLLEHGVHPDSRAYANGHVGVHYASPMHCAIRGGGVRIFQRLLRAGVVDLNCPVGPYGLGAFLAAVECGNTSVVMFLRDMTDIDPNITDARGMCAAAIVAKTGGSTGLMQELLRWDGMNVHIVDEEGKSALDYARERPWTGIEDVMLRHLYGYIPPLPEPNFELFPLRRGRRRGRKSRNGKKQHQSGDGEGLWRCYGVIAGDTLYSVRLIRDN